MTPDLPAHPVRLATLCAVAVAASIGALAPSTAGAQHLLEPEIGIKAFDGKINDLIGPGICLGGTYARVASPSVAVTLHGDLGFHTTRRSGDFAGDPGGGSFALAIGAMVSPRLRAGDRAIAPYAGAAAGYGSAGIGPATNDSWTLGLEGGLRLRMDEGLGMVLGLRACRHFWGNSGSPMDASDEIVLAGRMSFRLPA